MTPFNRGELKSLGISLATVAVHADISYSRMARAFYGNADHLTPAETLRALRVIKRAKVAQEAMARANEQAERDLADEDALIAREG